MAFGQQLGMRRGAHVLVLQGVKLERNRGRVVCRLN